MSEMCQHNGCVSTDVIVVESTDFGESQEMQFCEDHLWVHGFCRGCHQQISTIDRSCGCVVDEESLQSRDKWEADLMHCHVSRELEHTCPCGETPVLEQGHSPVMELWFVYCKSCLRGMASPNMDEVVGAWISAYRRNRNEN